MADLKKETNEPIIPVDEEGKPLGFFGRISLYVRDNIKLVSWILLAAAVLTLAIVFGVKYLKDQAAKNREKAGTALSRVLPMLSSGDENAIKLALYGNKTMRVRNEPLLGLVDIARKYKSTPQGKLAAFYAGYEFNLEGKYADAEKYFKIAVDADSKIVIEGAYAGLGAVSEAKGDFSGAIENYQKAVENFTSYASKSRYEYYQGLCYEKLNKKSEAVKIYKGIIAENKSTEFVGRSQGALTRLGTEIE